MTNMTNAALLKTKHVIVVGAGVGGLVSALLLAHSGVRVTLVESAAAIETRLVCRQKLRSIWWCVLNGKMPNSNDIALLADTLGISELWLISELAKLHTFGQLFEQVEQRVSESGIWLSRWKSVEIEQAIGDLRLRVESLRFSHQKFYVKMSKSFSEQKKEDKVKKACNRDILNI